MSTTLTVDDELLAEAQRLTGLTEKSDVVREAQSFAFYPLETGFGSFFCAYDRCRWFGRNDCLALEQWLRSPGTPDLFS